MISIFPLANTYLNIYADRCEFSTSSDSAALLTVNIQNASLSVNHTHSLSDIGAAAENHTHTLAALGAAAATHTHTPASIGAAAASHTHQSTNVFRYMGSGASSSRSFGVSPSHTVREVQIYRDNLGLLTHWTERHSTTLVVFPGLYYQNVVHSQTGNWQVDFFDAALVSKFEQSGIYYDVVVHSD